MVPSDLIRCERGLPWPLMAEVMIENIAFNLEESLERKSKNYIEKLECRKEKNVTGNLEILNSSSILLATQTKTVFVDLNLE